MLRALARAAVLCVCASTPVQALPVTDVVDPENIFLSFGSTPSSCPAGISCNENSLTFVHDITQSGFQIGDIIESAHIQIRLAELVTTGVNHETYRYSIGTQGFECLNGNCVPNSGVLHSISLVMALPDLADDGKIAVTLQVSSGSFYFADSILTAEVTSVVPQVSVSRMQQVPLPSTLLLLGAGLLAVGTAKCRRVA